MFDVEVALPNQPGALANLGEAMGRIGTPLKSRRRVHPRCPRRGTFPVPRWRQCQTGAEAAGIPVAAIRRSLIRKLRRGTPGQLGATTRSKADAGMNVLVQYSYHHNRLVCGRADQAARATV